MAGVFLYLVSDLRWRLMHPVLFPYLVTEKVGLEVSMGSGCLE